MEATTSTHFYAWMEDEQMPAEPSVKAGHTSAQVDGQPKYVADICDRFAAEKTDEEQKSCVIRGYN